MKIWNYNYGGNDIAVINRWNVADLLVNGEVQDRVRGGFLTHPLTGSLNTGEQIKVDLGGVVAINCTLFVNHKLQPTPKARFVWG